MLAEKEDPKTLLGRNGRFFIKIYEYRFEKTINNVPISKDDFIPKWKSPTELVPFYEFTFKLNDNIPDKI